MSKFSKILLLVVAFFTMFLLVGCDKDDEINVTVSAIKTQLVVGETTTVTATVTPSVPAGVTVEITSSNVDVVTVNVDGLTATVTAIGVGTADVTASVGDVSAKVTITVVAATVPVTGVTVTAPKTTLEITETTQATAVVAPENATDKTVTFSTSNAAVATVSATGLITAVAAGTATITATAGSQTATITITVNAAVVPVTSVQLTVVKDLLVVGDTTQATAVVLPENATNKTVTFASSDVEVATVSTTGLITAVGAGTVTITATSGSQSATVEIEVVAAAETIQFALDALVGDLVRVRGVVHATIGRNVYIQDAEVGISIFNVPVDELVHFAVGNEVIVDAKRAAFSGIRQLADLTDVVVLSTNNPVKDAVELDDLAQATLIENEYLLVSGTFGVVAKPNTVAVDDNGQLTAHLSFRLSDGTNESVFYVHRSTSAAAIEGLLAELQAIEIGGLLTFTNVTVTYFNSVAQLYLVEQTELEFTPPADPTMVIIQGDAAGNVGSTIQLTAVSIPAGKVVTFEWSTSDETIATVSNTGLVTLLKDGEVTITVNIVGFDVSASKVITVNIPLPAEVDAILPEKFVEGEEYQLSAVVTPLAAPQEVTWESSNSDIATISETGLLTAVAPGAVTITVTSAARPAISMEYNIVIEAYIEPKIEITAPSAIQLGSTVQLSAVVFSNYASQNVLWSSSDEEVISITESGLIEALKAGEVVITATSADDETITASVTVQVITLDHSNILIDASLADTTDTEFEFEGNTYYVGLNAFASFKGIENVLEDGITVYVLPGTYADRFTINKSNVSIIGPNAGINPVTDLSERGEEAIITARVSFGPDVENTLIDGLKFINSGALYSSVPVVNLVAQNLYFTDSSVDAGQGVIFFGLVSADLVNENILITQSVFDDSRFLGYRAIRINNGKDLTISSNYFYKFYDAIRLEGSVNSGWVEPGTGAGATGTIIIDGNIFEDSFQYSILLGRYSATHVQITNNKIDAYAEGNGSYGHINLLNPQYTDTKMVVDILYNVFESPTNWHHVRIQRYFALTTDEIEFNVNWNKFMYPPLMDGETPLGYIHKGSDAISAGNIINGANNYYATSELPASAFFGTSTYEPYFLNEAQFDYALAVHLGIAGDELEITSSITEVMVDFEIQLTANKPVSWESSDEETAIVDENGKVKGIEAGTVTITATFEDETVTVVITVIARPAPTSFEIVGEDILVLNETTQLSVDLTSLVPITAYPDVTWSTSDEAIATVDEEGLVTAVGPGTVTITATSVKDSNVTATLEITVENILFSSAQILIDPALAETPMYTHIEFDSFDYYVGLNAFASLKAAEDAIADGSTVIILAGTYSEAFTIKVSNVSFIGPNAGINPVTDLENRVAEANVTARISFGVGVENTLIDGIMFTGLGQIRTINPVKNVTIQNVYFNGANLPSANAAEGSIFFGMANDAHVNENILIQNSLFFDNKDVGRAIRLNNAKNLTVINNKFVGYFDPVCLEGTNSSGWTTPGSGVGAAGTLLIDGNRFEGTLQYPIRIGRYTATHVVITNNTFNVNSGRSGVFGLMNILNATYVDQKIVVDIMYNTFENAANFHHVRIQRYFELTDEQIEFNVNWNKFMFASVARESDGLQLAYIHKGSDAISAGNIINAANNYYAMAELPAAAFFGTSTYTPYFLDLAAFELALADHLAGIVPDFAFTSEVDEVMVDFDIQLMTNQPATFESSDEAIATVDETGKVTGIAPGSVTITATNDDEEEITIVITVVARPAPTSFEIDGPTTVLLGESITLAVDLSSLVPIVALPDVIWTSSNNAIATIDENGVITTVFAGEVTITATSTLDNTVTATHVVTVEAVDYDPSQVLIDPSVASMDFLDAFEFDSFDYVVGLNAFATLKAAEDRIEAGATVIVLAGTYSEAFTVKVSDVSFVGPNAGINPITDMDDREDEAVITARVTLASGIENILFDGLKLTGAGKIFANTAQKNVTIQYMHVHNVTDDGSQGAIFFGLASEALQNESVLIQHNFFQDTIDTGRAIRINNAKDLVVQNNKFQGYFDPIRLEGSGNSGFGALGTGSGVAGVTIIDSNVFDLVKQYSIIITRYTAAHLQITNNDFTINTATTSFGIIYASNAVLTGEEMTFDIMYNTFNNFNGSNMVRLVRYYDLTSAQFKLNVNWNKFIGVPAVTYVTSQGPTNATNSIINAANNYYNAPSLLASQFVGVTTYSPAFLDLADFEYALSVHKGEVNPLTVQEVRDLASGTVVTKGVVTARIGNNAFIQDGTAGIYVFMSSNTAYDAKLAIGNEVYVAGTRGAFNQLAQISSVSGVYLVTQNNALPVNHVMTDVDNAALLAVESQLVSFTGLTIKTIPPIASAAYTVVVTDGTNDLQIRVDATVAEFQAIKDLFLGAIPGQTVDFANIPVGRFNAAAQLMLSRVDQITIEPASMELLESHIEALLDPGTNFNTSIVLPLEVTVAGVTYDITWDSTNEAVLGTDGTVVRPEVGQPNAEVTLTANVEIDDDTTFTIAYDVVVLAFVEGEETIVLAYETGFESAEGFTTSTTYNNVTPRVQGPENFTWSSYYGTVATTGFITGAQSAQNRWYTSAADRLGWFQTDFTIVDVRKVEFKAIATGGLNVSVSYSSNGTDWVGTEVFTLTSSAADYTYEIEAEGAVYIRFQIVLPETVPTANQQIRFDDVKIYHVQQEG